VRTVGASNSYKQPEVCDTSTTLTGNPMSKIGAGSAAFSSGYVRLPEELSGKSTLLSVWSS